MKKKPSYRKKVGRRKEEKVGAQNQTVMQNIKALHREPLSPKQFPKQTRTRRKANLFHYSAKTGKIGLLLNYQVRYPSLDKSIFISNPSIKSLLQ
jgi:UDP-glucose 4-epimerase